MDVERVTRGTPATLTATFRTGEIPADADGIVTVTIVKADGTAFASGEATHSGVPDSGTYSFNIVGSPTLNVLAATWAGDINGAAATVTTSVEVVGGTYFTISELRAVDTVLADETKYPLSALQETRAEVETEFERICNRAFVPRFARETVTGEGTDTIRLRKYEPLSILTIDGVVADDSLFESDGYRALSYIARTTWSGRTRYVLEYEYGTPNVPIDIKNAALRRARGKLVSGRSRIDERATVMSIPDFGTFNLSTPGKGGAYTGIPDIDLVLNDYAYGRGGVV